MDCIKVRATDVTWIDMLRGVAAPACHLICLLVPLAGCVQTLPIPLKASAPVPEYGVGDTYRFSDGTTESVIAMDHDTVRWRSNGGTHTTSREVLLPRLAWTSASTRGDRRIASALPLLFPLEPGKRAAFSATRTVRPIPGRTSVSVHEDWQCDVAGTARVTTQAGVFDTWRVDCSMTEQQGTTSGPEVRRRFYYAPEIGFYVRRDERMGDQPAHEVDLVGYSAAEPALPDSALRLRVDRIQQVLEGELSGDVLAWRDPATGDNGDVAPVRTIQSSQYGWCRDFAEHIRAAGRAYALQGTGCRNPSGIWVIIALAPASGTG